MIFPLYKPSFSLVQTIPCLSVQPFGKHNLEATRFLSLHPPSVFGGDTSAWKHLIQGYLAKFEPADGKVGEELGILGRL